MNTHEHVKKLVNLGFLVNDNTREKIEGLDEEKLLELIEKMKKSNAFIVDDSILNNILTEDVKILKEYKSMNNFTIHDYVGKLNEKYNFLKNLLLKKLEITDIVSIKECSNGKATIIGFVNTKEEKDDKYLLSLEDPTETIKVLVQKKMGERVELDDVIAVTGEINNSAMLAERVIFPDVSFKPVNYSADTIKLAFTDKKAKADYVVSISEIRDNIKKKKHNITVPCVFKINNITILLVSGVDPLNVLKKRFIPMKNKDFIIDYEPDIVLTDQDIKTNYKGISILSKNKIIDLKTREIQDI